MNSEKMVIVNNISKVYTMNEDSKQKFKKIFSSKPNKIFFRALNNVSFIAHKGECIGLLGFNGSGKSTLAKIISGVTKPTSGEVTLNGTSSMIAVSSGLNAQMTGLENIEIKGLMLGLTMQQINLIKDDIIKFADIGDFINQPVKMYSSGMKSRLGFAISVNIDPDIMVIDEALSVGDPTFTQKCLDKMNEFRKSGKTIFFVSHSLPQIKSFCDKALWLEYGNLRAFGEIEEVLPSYERFITQFNSWSDIERNKYKQEVIGKGKKM